MQGRPSSSVQASCHFLELLLVSQMAHRAPSSQRTPEYGTLKDLPVPEGAAGITSNPCTFCRSPMNPGNPPPYPGPGPTAPYPPYPQQPMGPEGYPPGPMGGPYPPPQGYPYQGYPQYGWQGGPQEPPKTTVYVVERERKMDVDTGCQAALAACWTALCCCCLLDNLN
ncbi:cysteine-rich and transmembrane domain-containing protein 1 isoform X3 [Panthera tigris]|uniref:cysteine-rich and transmembrane domain-containing protein 1 isoform X3 n=1 Tax=Panthera tigris TaxID=9694 RepID=UPI001C6A5FC6|nr:cysteine-rich and transmembrane domain-containing protein 1 isoform X3 [Panthera tigris]XP_042792861.1 cysteine-rich and transmembrane domain-containing protein 1 isoform X2 [Panthera leo]